MQQLLQFSASVMFISVVLLLCIKCWNEQVPDTAIVFDPMFKRLSVEIAVYVSILLLIGWILHQAQFGAVNIVDFKATWWRGEFTEKNTVNGSWPHLYPLIIGLFGRVIEDAQFGLSVSLSFVAWLGASYFLYRLTCDSVDEHEAYNHLRYWLVFPFTLQLWLPGNTSLLACLIFASLWYWRQQRLRLFIIFALLALWTDIRALGLVVPIAGTLLLPRKVMDLALWTLGLALMSLLPSVPVQSHDVLLSGWPLLMMTKFTRQPVAREFTLLISLLATGGVLYAQILG